MSWFKLLTVVALAAPLAVSAQPGPKTNTPAKQTVPKATAATSSTADAMIAAPDINWTRPDPSAPYSLAKLWGDFHKGQAGVLQRLPGGFKGPAHAHTSDYRAVVISGTWVHVVTKTGKGKGVKLGPGSYYTQRANELHADECVSAEPCVFFRFTESE